MNQELPCPERDFFKSEDVYSIKDKRQVVIYLLNGIHEAERRLRENPSADVLDSIVDMSEMLDCLIDNFNIPRKEFKKRKKEKRKNDGSFNDCIVKK